MKKLVLLLLICVSIFAFDIKDNRFFINLNGGALKIYQTKSFEGVKLGYYFYDPNIYHINNRIYIESKKINTTADFYISTINLDWLFNNKTIFTPYVGLNFGYLYFKDNGIDDSSGIWGAEGGIILNITNHIGLDFRFTWQKAYEKQRVWNRSLKSADAGLEISF